MSSQKMLVAVMFRSYSKKKKKKNFRGYIEMEV